MYAENVLQKFVFKNVCSKQVGGYFLVYVSLRTIVCLMLYYKKVLFKTSGKLLFSFLSYCSNTKNVCSKQEAASLFIHY